jgi:hypothetical protein
VLNRQLSAVALLNPLEEGKTDADVIFNDGASAVDMRVARA